jgi:hypothetical protein
MAAVALPSPALAYSSLALPSVLRDQSGYGYFEVSMRNSSNQVIGKYGVEMSYDYYNGKYRLHYYVCAMDTLIGNGRGVVARVLLKSGSNTSTEVVKLKGGTNAWNCTSPMYASVKETSFPIWGVDVDHGEDWSGVPYQYTGHYNRYVRQNENPDPSKPSFHTY